MQIGEERRQTFSCRLKEAAGTHGESNLGEKKQSTDNKLRAESGQIPSHKFISF
jgi:hypothetical protein